MKSTDGLGFGECLSVIGVLCLGVCMIGCGEPPREPVIETPRVEQAGGGEFAAIQPGQSVTLTLSTSGLRLNDMPIPDDQLQSVLADLVRRGVLADASVTVSVDKDVRVLNRKALLKRLEDQQVRYELLEESKGGK